MSFERVVSVEVLRDIETTSIPLHLAVASLREIQQVTDGLKIIDSGDPIVLSDPGSGVIHTDKLPWSDIRADFAIVLTDRRIIMPPDLHNPLSPGNITVGLTDHVAKSKPFSIIDFASTLSVKNSLKHEFGHEVGLGHCGHDRCNMHAICTMDRADYCASCAGQLARKVFSMISMDHNSLADAS